MGPNGTQLHGKELNKTKIRQKANQRNLVLSETVYALKNLHYLQLRQDGFSVHLTNEQNRNQTV